MLSLNYIYIVQCSDSPKSMLVSDSECMVKITLKMFKISLLTLS